jgi:hypothetical protein
MISPKILFNIGAISLVVFMSVTFPHSATADLFCYPWERDCEANGRIGDDPFGTDYDYEPFYQVYAHNKTDRAIWVAAHYRSKSPSDARDYNALAPGALWQTHGYWKLEPGERALILNEESRIDNRYIYFHAHDEYGNIWGNQDHQFDVRGKHQLFFQANMGEQIGTYTQGFK